MASKISEEQLVTSEIEGYKLAGHKSHYGGIEQRWLVVESQSRREADQHKLQQKLLKSAERGFGFLKDPLFFTDSIFINSPERVEALAMCFWDCVY